MFRKRVGVFVCHCGSNIAGVVRVHEVVEYVREIPDVVHVAALLYACSEDGLASIKEKIRELNLNRVVVAACTPRTHESVFRNACEQVGLNKYLFEFVNIREHCSWIHHRMPDEATEKAKELIRMGVVKAYFLESQEEIETPIYPAVLVIGGGITGMTAALNLANQNIKVHLVERENNLGGLLVNVDKLFSTDQDARGLLEPIVEKVTTHPNITLHLGSKIQSVSGFIGGFDVELKTQDARRKTQNFKVGTIIVATGAKELKPDGEYGYGRLDGVLTQLELEKRLAGIWNLSSVVMINCVGARVKERQYCGRFCCLTAMKNACIIKDKNPDAKVYILQRDVMAYGAEFEKYYKRAMEAGVRFIRYNPLKAPQVIRNQKVIGATSSCDKVEAVKVYHELVGKEIVLPADMVVLTTPLVAQDDAELLSKMLKVPLGSEGFFLEAHLKLRPIEFATDGIYLCGCCRYPAEISECVSQAYAASAKAAIPIKSGTVKVEAITATSDEEICSGCGNCVEVCPFDAIELKQPTDRVLTQNIGGEGVPHLPLIANVNEVECKGCGLCVSVCPNGAMQQKGFNDQQLLSMVNSLTEAI